MAIARIVAPVAVVIKVIEADYIPREILRRAGKVVAVVAALGPGIEFVRIVNRLDIGIERVGSAECGSLPAAQREGLACTRRCALAGTDTDYRITSIGTRLDAIMPGLENIKRLP
ncbi:MAG: hypothetical protein WA899_17350 [Candidatus Sulfotelmatobacter sp.]